MTLLIRSAKSKNCGTLEATPRLQARHSRRSARGRQDFIRQNVEHAPPAAQRPEAERGPD
ncbi:hypothetical protein E2C01_047702 [Portunus trituberculatus]|uniref:Uncharacterized protein n=1 Tax=Portunus trituberculatus TaxID=210409 RepID=A0A5B7G4B1_PORTR|nr:hypothetical protein [Portunus trituberculatus]